MSLIVASLRGELSLSSSFYRPHQGIVYVWACVVCYQGANIWCDCLRIEILSALVDNTTYSFPVYRFTCMYVHTYVHTNIHMNVCTSIPCSTYVYILFTK